MGKFTQNFYFVGIVPCGVKCNLSQSAPMDSSSTVTAGNILQNGEHCSGLLRFECAIYFPV